MRMDGCRCDQDDAAVVPDLDDDRAGAAFGRELARSLSQRSQRKPSDVLWVRQFVAYFVQEEAIRFVVVKMVSRHAGQSAPAGYVPNLSVVASSAASGEDVRSA